MTLSPRLSFQGYRISEALYRNKDILKLLLGVITGYSYFTGFEWMPFTIAVGGAIVLLVTKLAFDAFDYYFSEVDISTLLAKEAAVKAAK